MSEKGSMSLTTRIMIGMALGVVVGFLFKLILAGEDELLLDLGLFAFPVKGFFVDGLFNIGGQIFIASLKMLVVPLVFVSLVCGTCSLSDPKTLGRLGGKSIAMYVGTTAIAITVAITLALLVSPGDGVTLPNDATFDAKEAPTLAQVIINMFPTNPIDAMASGNMLQVIVFALLFGIAMALSGEAGQRLSAVFEDLNNVILKLVTLLMNIAPYGVFCLMAKLFTTIELGLIWSLMKYFGVVVAALLIHGLINYSILLKVLTGLNPVTFLSQMKHTCLFAFSTSSSSATMPITLETATKKLGASNSVASFTVPLGATINMDGTAIMQGCATVFIAQVFGVDLSISDYLMVILTATLASVGTAGVPGVGLIMLAMVLNQVGLPVEGIAIIIGVDRLLDMTRTAVNVTGDCMVTCVVAKSEGQLDETVFNDLESAKELEEYKPKARS
ncbi:MULTISPECIES: dicarboxylate/amino acid:cation symporter [Pseudoalteromonas]|uniref:Dicarboxylate/amino acid:cation symporter n=2 Tax=Pseudoalteromonas ruthenica TaxID=151081 RepID=A0A0F4PW83_9GAMM|nr:MULTISPECIES: dicarboxylate/amino acid:cation symporter [Pseudoalteromonas]KJY99672.1 sodium:dicarboxylate symporter [Pseudoalteromonas ruthenica]KJZ00110.1 sodium:dicarboxylate symporter [Pseudoalteromonas ruthenica]MCF2861423.1 dicarboxylate/amino acid:cation symporter [Pseudoalteromonas sp. CNAT2-18]MCG7542802.1 dicarboxylate/amino acid:cation symporter [Pseudoalteromonas sp. MM17-2]MCG7557538.1 dicarboxylate/amino acid:cation symporter [Pseudoalteromonas sp. CNAT2-18.1]|tara:strand:- start:1170 stop:2504 length:1335 start_codon:yes stop_codon:yes gene_type:complete